jgi:AraC family transcriptional regulator, transcriptional activator of pobA
MSPSRRRQRRAALPAFVLYGEAGSPGLPLLHVESIEARSRLHDWEIDSHVHHGLHQIVWLRAGPVTALLDDTRSEAQGPLAVVIPPAVAHAFRFTPASDGFVLTVDARLLTEGDDSRLGAALQALFAAPRVLAVAPADAAPLHALCQVLLAESTRDAGTPVPTWLARAFVWRLAEQTRRGLDGGPREAGHDALYTRWLVLLEAHYREHWPVTRYAQRLGLSTDRLNRLVRAETGMTAQAALHARLMREACRRLVHVAAPVSRIGFELGFDDPAYFCRFFKRHAGVAPRAYRVRREPLAR